MSRLPSVSGREVLKALHKLGYKIDRRQGSHVILRQTLAPHRRLTVGNHDEIAKGTLPAIIRQKGHHG